MPGRQKVGSQFWLGTATRLGAEAFLELVDPAFGIHKLLLSREKRMRIGSNADSDQIVLNAVNHFLAVGSFGGTGHDAGARGHINENNGIVLGMNILFHKKLTSRGSNRAGAGL